MCGRCLYTVDDEEKLVELPCITAWGDMSYFHDLNAVPAMPTRTSILPLFSFTTLYISEVERIYAGVVMVEDECHHQDGL